MSVTTPPVFSPVTANKMPWPPWVKVTAAGTALVLTSATLSWLFIAPHHAAKITGPKVDYTPTSLKAPDAPPPPSDSAPAAPPATASVPGPVADIAVPVHLMNVWSAPPSGPGQGASYAPAPRQPAGYAQQGRSAPDDPAQTEAARPTTEYGANLTSTHADETEARVDHDRSLLLPESKTFGCLPDAPLDNQLAGKVSCTVTEDVWSDDGANILINRWATVSGEVQRGLGLGQNRAFIVWTRVRSAGVRADLDSPGVDLLGQMGVPGIVDEHWWQKIKAATLLTGVETVSNVATAEASKAGSTSVNFNQGQSLASQALQHDISIPATLWRGQAAPLRIMVNHDVQFHRAYRNVLVAGRS